MKKCILCLFFVTLQISYSQFSQINNGIFGCEIKSVAISGNNVFVGIYEKGLYFSSDYGDTWCKKDSSFFNLTNNNRIHTVVSDKDNIFVGAENGLYLTTDSGESWENVSKVTGYTTGPVTAMAVKGDSLYGVFYRRDLYLSTNYGKNWISAKITSDTPKIGEPSGFKSIAIKGEIIFLGKDNGFIKVSQAGKEVKNSGLRDSSIKSIIVKGDNIFVGTRAGVFKSSDDGDYWVEKNSGLTNLYINSLVVDRDNIIAATRGGIFFSTDNGETWFDKNNGLSILNVNSLAIKGNIIYAGTSGGIFLSTDYGEHWVNKTQNINILPRITKLAFKQSSLFAGTYGNGVFRSTDLGDSWTQEILGLEGFKINTFAVDGDKIFVGTDGGVYLSTDDGEHWVQKNVGITSMNISSLLIKENYIFASTYDKGIFVSADNGESWEERNNNLPTLEVRCLANIGDILFAGTDGILDPYSSEPNVLQAWICTSSDNGNNWNILKQVNGQVNVLSSSKGYLFSGLTEFPAISNYISISSDTGKTWRSIGNWGSLMVYDIISDGYYVFGAVDFNCIPQGILGYGEMRELQCASLPPPYYRARTLAISPDNIYFYVGTDSGGVYRTTLGYIVSVKNEDVNTLQSLYPNPAREYITVGPYIGWQYQIYDLLGNCVQPGLIDSERINVSALSTGFYTIRIFKNGKQYVSKIMKE